MCRTVFTVTLILVVSLQRMPRPSEAALQAAMATRQQAQPQPPRTPQALPPGRQATYASQLQPQVRVCFAFAEQNACGKLAVKIA